MKLKIYTLWEDADEDKLKYKEVNICGNYVEYFQSPDEHMEGYEYSKRFFKYKKDDCFKKMFPKIKPNYFIKIYHSSVTEEIGDDSSIAGYLGYAHINFFQKQYLDWYFGKHLIKKPKKLIKLIFQSIKEIRKIFYGN